MSSRLGSAPLPLSARPWVTWLKENALWGAAVIASSVLAGVAAGAAPLLLVGLCALIIGTVGFATWPVATLGAIVLTRASLDSDAFLGGLYLQERMAAITAVCGGLATLFIRRYPKSPLVTIPFALFLLLGAVSIRFSPDPTETLRAWLRLASLLVVFCLAAWLVRDRQGLTRLVAGILLASVVPLAAGLWQLVTGSGVDRAGFSELALYGTFTHPGGYSFFLLVVIPLALVGLFEFSSAWARASCGGLLAIATLSLVFTYSRSAWIALVLVVGIMAILQYPRLLPVAGIGVLVAAIAVPSQVGLVEQRFRDVLTGSEDNSFTWRVNTWQKMLPYATDRPLTGHGLGSFGNLTFFEYGRNNPKLGSLTKSERETGLAAHNDYLKVAVELGIPGLLLWIAMLLGLATAAWRARRVTWLRPYAVTTMALVSGLVLVSTVDNVQAYTGVGTYLMALGGGVIGAGVAAGGQRRPSE